MLSIHTAMATPFLWCWVSVTQLSMNLATSARAIRPPPPATWKYHAVICDHLSTSVSYTWKSSSTLNSFSVTALLVRPAGRTTVQSMSATLTTTLA